jgi:hypothetical protein
MLVKAQTLRLLQSATMKRDELALFTSLSLTFTSISQPPTILEMFNNLYCAASH